MFLILIFVLCFNHCATSLVPPYGDASIHSESPPIFVFFCPPASFVHHQITTALELYRRGHRVVFATLEGFQPHLDSQLTYFEPNDQTDLIRIVVFTLGDKVNFDLNGIIERVTQTVKSDDCS